MPPFEIGNPVPTSVKQPIDYLNAAINGLKPTDQALAPLPHSDEPQGHDRATADRDARNKLDQEFLLAHPAEMRKLFPGVLAHTDLNHDAHLDSREIEQGLQSDQLSEHEQNLLKVLKQGYDQFRWDPNTTIDKDKFSQDPSGISAGSLAMIDKAVNRNIKEDPYYSWTKFAEAAGVGVAGGIGGFLYAKIKYHEDAKIAAYTGVFSGLAIGAMAEFSVLYNHYSGKNDKLYDQAKTSYQSFVNDFHSGNAKPST